MKSLIKLAAAVLGKQESAVRAALAAPGRGARFYAESIHVCGDGIVAMGRDARRRSLLVIGRRRDGTVRHFSGEKVAEAGAVARICPLDADNAAALRELFPWTAPVSLRGRSATIGCGDRLGLATAGQLAAVRGFAVAPVLAQQSMRELNLTGRSYRAVVDDATFGVFQAGYHDGYGADGDHLKKIADIDTALAAGMPMITLDLSEVMNPAAGTAAAGEVDAGYAALPRAVRNRLRREYADREFTAGGRALRLDAATVKRCALMYLRALDFAAEVDAHLRRRRGDAYDLEISIDETTVPTLPEHHFFIARELTRRGVAVSSLAPRFVGEFQKGVDYRGDLREFARQFAVHAAIARTSGGYKVSVHSGSDKFSAFPAVGKGSGGRFHLKTAGTSWLEAVRTIARREPQLYRAMHRRALTGFESARKLYHVTTDLAAIPDPGKMDDAELPSLLEQDDARQLLHITYGELLGDVRIRPRFFAAMHRHEAAYHAFLTAHFAKHLVALGVECRG